MFIILVVVMVLQVYMYVNTIKIYSLNMCSLLYSTSIKLLKKTQVVKSVDVGLCVCDKLAASQSVQTLSLDTQGGRQIDTNM